ncbi:Ig-like domain-containing protein, partial [Vogesella indigofera]|uniref:Ig-like domain-containing protein n=1 Tax=Vogesella indigofera TaxID=45465 RepID=UPI00234C6327
DVLGNDTDVDDGHVLSLVSASAPAGMGSASVVGGQLQFDPGTDFDHLAKDAVVHVTLNYTMTDQFGAESNSTVDVTVTGTNDGPLAVADTAAGTENQLLTIDVLGNDTDVDDGHVLSLLSASAPVGMGSASVVGGQLQFDPGTDFDHLAKDAVVHVTLSYTMTDQFGATSSSTVDVTVTGTNDGPLAVADTADGTENQLLTIDVLGNDTDVDDGHVLSLLSASAPAGMGSASVVGGQLQFDPGTDFDHLAKDAVVHVTLNYTMTDQFGAESSSTVDVTVTGTNDGPLAVADTAAGTENQLLTIDVLGNDTDVDDGHVLSLLSASAPAGMGSASVVGGQLQFDPGTDFDHLAKDAVVHVTLSYTMTDQFGAESSSTVDVTVTGTNDLASITGTSSGSVQEATASAAGVPTTGGTLLLSDVDDGEAVFQLPASLDGVYGSFTLDTDSGVWSYLLDNSRAATQALNSGTTVYDTLLVKSYDGTAQQTITVSIQGATDNSAPQFLSSGVLVSMFEHLLNAATSPTGFASTLLGSVLASDADGNALTYSLLSDASGGGFQISAGGAVSVKDLSLLDYESAALIPGGGGARGYALEVAVSDGIAAPVTTTLYIEVKDVITGLSGGNQTDYLDGGSGGETLIGGGQADVVFGDGGNDTLTGDTGTGAEKADQLFGGAGNDQLFGNGDSDMLRGGSGNDALTGGTGSDTFVWSLADIAGGPYTDTVKDWGAGGTADKLDLRDLLQGEHANALSLDGYLDFSYASGNTTIAVHSAGAGTAVTQSIVLESIQLTGADDQAIISNLLSSNKLVVDV